MDTDNLLVFARVAQAGSFSKAARQLGMPVSTVSRKVAGLEKQLGLPLLLRTTRSLKVTDIGTAYLAHGNAIARELEKAQALATNLQSIPQGTLRITATTDFGNRFLGDILGDYLKANPRVDADVVLTERVVDLIAEGFDLAIRMGELDDSTLLARRIGSIDLQLYASPAFLKEHGEPRTCADLARFACIRFTEDEHPDHWRLEGPKGITNVRVSGRVSSNNMVMVRDFALAGEGIAMMPHFLCAEDLKAGRLKLLLKSWVRGTGPIHVVYPGQRFPLPRVRTFIDHLTRSCAKIHWRAAR